MKTRESSSWSDRQQKLQREAAPEAAFLLSKDGFGLWP
jgi:hypothetical protein